MGGNGEKVEEKTSSSERDVFCCVLVVRVQNDSSLCTATLSSDSQRWPEWH